MAKRSKFNFCILSLALLTIAFVMLSYKSNLNYHVRNMRVYSNVQDFFQNGKYQKREKDNYSKINSVITMDDLHITVRTTKKSHKSRLQIILKTWFKQARNKVYIITDEDDEEVQKQTKGHLIPTTCESKYLISGLCCKTGSEFDTFINHSGKWWCHFDDDIYVNLKALLRLLKQFDWKEPFYIGRSEQRSVRYTNDAFHTPYWFLNGGAGICFSRGLAELMNPICGNGGLTKTCLRVNMIDDTTLGYIISTLLNVSITTTTLFHSHYEDMTASTQYEELEKQITFSYKGNNVTPFNGKYRPAFTMAEDPTRFLSIHCLLYPNDQMCPNSKVRRTK